MEAIILAGGLGTRLSSRLKGIPKSMAPIGDRPFMQILLERLTAAGCDRIILSVGHLHDVVRNAFGDTFHEVPLAYAVEESPLGTGGAIRMALEFAHSSPVLVLNGDTFLDIDLWAFRDAHLNSNRSLSLAIKEVPDVGRYGGVLIEHGLVTGFIEKGRASAGWINAGVYMINRDFRWPANLPARFSFENDVLVPHVDSLMPLAFSCSGYFLDIGIPEDLDRAQTELAGYRFTDRSIRT